MYIFRRYSLSFLLSVLLFLIDINKFSSMSVWLLISKFRAKPENVLASDCLHVDHLYVLERMLESMVPGGGRVRKGNGVTCWRVGKRLERARHLWKEERQKGKKKVRREREREKGETKLTGRMAGRRLYAFLYGLFPNLLKKEGRLYRIVNTREQTKGESLQCCKIHLFLSF